jgi:crotonobetainyl-CoA:carnitine CoA-transferase CaiB-like acyl-CoA transferase
MLHCQGLIMMTLEDIRNDRALLNSIDWSMTPEEAVTLYLEWGNNSTHSKKMVKSKKDVSYYFVVSTWDEPPKIYLVRRNSDEAVDLAAFELPPHLRNRFMETVARRKSVYALTPEVREWLQKETEKAA